MHDKEISAGVGADASFPDGEEEPRLENSFNSEKIEKKVDENPEQKNEIRVELKQKEKTKYN